MQQDTIQRKIGRVGRMVLFLLLTFALFVGVTAFDSLPAEAADPPNQPFDLIFSAENVRYRVDHFGVGTLGSTTGDLIVPQNVIDGTAVVKAYLIWSGLGQDADGVLFERVGGAPPARITHDWLWNNDTYGGASTWGCCGGELSVYAADITDTDIVTVSTSVTTYTVSDMEVQHLRNGVPFEENWGVSLLIIYEADDVNLRDVYVKLGNDGLFYNWAGLIGPHSDVQCMGFEAQLRERNATFEVIVGGVANETRFNALWGRSGNEDYVTRTVEKGATWNQNQGLINLPPNINGIDPALNAVEEPTAANGFTSPFDDSAGDEWDVYKRFNVNIPAGHDWACLQVESAAQENRPDLPPIVPNSPTFENVPASIGFLGFIAFLDRAEPPVIAIEKQTNGADADDPNGSGAPVITPGDVVTWTYEVTNVGTVDIPQAEITVTDNIIGEITTIVDQGDGDSVLSPNETWIYQATGNAINLVNPPAGGDLQLVENVCTQAGAVTNPSTAYTNIGTVTIPTMEDTDPSSYCGPLPQIEIIKYTNGLDANDPNGSGVPMVSPGGSVVWHYDVTNSGVVDINEVDITVTDNVIGDITVIVDKGDGGSILSPGETWRYQATGAALNLVNPPVDPDLQLVDNVCTQGGVVTTPSTAYTNIGTVTIPTMQDTDPSSYCGPQPSISIIKYTNGQDADDPNGPGVPILEAGDPITWTYAVTNNGPVEINEADITVTDSVEGTVTSIADKGDGDAILSPNETWIYFANGQAIDLTSPGNQDGLELLPNVCTQGSAVIAPSTAYTNLGVVTIPAMQDSNPSSYCGPEPTAVDGGPEPESQGMKLFLPLSIQ